MGEGISNNGGFKSLLWTALGGACGSLLAWELRDARERKLRITLNNHDRLIAVDALKILNTALAQADERLKTCSERHDRLLDLVIDRYLHCTELDEALASARNAEAQASEHSRHLRLLQQRIFSHILNQNPGHEINQLMPIATSTVPSPATASLTAGISRCVARASVPATFRVPTSASDDGRMDAGYSAGARRVGRSRSRPLAFVPCTISAFFRRIFKTFCT